MTFLSRMQPSPAPIAPRRLPEAPSQGPANRPAQRPAVGRPGDGFEVRGGRAGPAGVGGCAAPAGAGGHAAPAGAPGGIAAGGVSGGTQAGPVAGGAGSDGPGALGLEGGGAGQVQPDVQASGGVGGTVQPQGAMEQLLQSARDNVPGFTWLESKVDGALKVLGAGTDVTGSQADIESMKPGDKFSTSGGFDGGYKIGRLQTRAQIEVSCEEGMRTHPTTGAREPGPNYRLSIDSEVLGGVGFENSKLDAKLLAGGGGKVEFKFETPAEVARANRIMDRMKTGMQANIAGAADMPPKEDIEWLQSKMAAVELRGTGAAQFAADIPVPGGPLVNNLDVGGKARSDRTVRIEFPEGKPPEVVIKDAVQVEVGGGPNRNLEVDKSIVGPDRMKLPIKGGVKVGASLKGSGKLEVETRIPLPTGAKTDEILKDPKAALGPALKDLAANSRSKVTLTVEGAGLVQGNGKGTSYEVSIEGNPGTLVKNGAFGKLLEGDVPGAFKTAGEDTKVEYKETSYTQRGVSMAPGFKVGPVKVGWELEVARRTVDGTPTVWTGNGADAARWLEGNPEKQAA
ncbi:hypothetical protein [Corallococcus sp. AB038B]|uniref:hypothetical protein n=1 Tax=Corallococcus sp. AB038B TaxID=2316718 RepID=UPI000EE0EB22|nr:hypothetical protein [Corallococcus sp. AB038B]RKI05227.1 hypothetical protein D7Y04_10330 [Corallococcus sp. AB038B]